MKTLVIGLGNPLLGDDGVGWRVAERVRSEIESATHFPRDETPYPSTSASLLVEVDCLSVGGLSLMERMIGFDRAIVIDAITTKQNAIGTVLCFPLEDLQDHSVGHLTSGHDTSLQNALKLGRQMGAHLPVQVTIVSIEAYRVYDFSEELTAEVAKAIPRATQVVIKSLQEQIKEE